MYSDDNWATLERALLEVESWYGVYLVLTTAWSYVPEVSGMGISATIFVSAGPTRATSRSVMHAMGAWVRTGWDEMPSLLLPLVQQVRDDLATHIVTTGGLHGMRATRGGT